MTRLFRLENLKRKDNWSVVEPPRLHAEVGYGTQAWLLHMFRRAEPSEAYPTTLI